MTATIITCQKCDGNKAIGAFYHIENGKCFECNGTGKVSVSRVKRKLTAATVEDKGRYVTRGEVTLRIVDDSETIDVFYKGECEGRACKWTGAWEFSDGLLASKWAAVRRAIIAGV